MNKTFKENKKKWQNISHFEYSSGSLNFYIKFGYDFA